MLRCSTKESASGLSDYSVQGTWPAVALDPINARLGLGWSVFHRLVSIVGTPATVDHPTTVDSELDIGIDIDASN